MAPRIAILSNYPRDHASFGTGVETATASLLEGLRPYQRRFEFHIVAGTNHAASDSVEERDGYWFHFLGTPKNPLARPRLPLRVIKAYKELKRIEPAVVHCHDNMALALAAVLAGYPRIFTVHGIKRHEAGKRTGLDFYSAHVDAVLERFVHRQFDSFIFVSRYARETVGRWRRAYSIPNAAGTRFFQAAAHPDLDQPTVVFVGTLEPLKRPDDLLLAHQELRRQFPRLESIFCGEFQTPGYSRRIHDMIRKHNIEGVRFEGRVGQARLSELFSHAIALVLPSSQENAPMVIAEAMAAGLPVVATRIGGIPDMVRDGENGLLYTAGDTSGLASCIRRLLLEPGEQSRLGDQARATARALFAPEQIARETVAAYQQILDESHHTNSKNANV
jgi:glycosyltransferase involved in cell wall biosynthesis